MPPLRTNQSGSAPKPARSERTHEENQERAYIAASRRSDRSLEARIESARRASEIHKKRTGRGLRVTEQDVINEEMYEEEEDDLPAHYRRLRQNLYAQGLVMNPGWEAASMLNVYMREAVLNGRMPSQAPSGYAHQPFFAYQHPGQQSTASIQQSQQQQTLPSPTSAYRHNPYSRVAQHQKSSSTSTPKDSSNTAEARTPLTPSATSDDQSRMSAPANSMPTTPQIATTPQIQPQSSRIAKAQDGSSGAIPPSPHATDLAHLQRQALFQQAHQNFGYPPGYLEAMGQPNFNVGPLTAALPLNQQQIMGMALNPSDSSTQYLMAGSQMMPQPMSYNFSPNIKPSQIHQGANPGMDHMLAASPFTTTMSFANASNNFGTCFDGAFRGWDTYPEDDNLFGHGSNGNTTSSASLMLAGASNSGTNTPTFGGNDSMNDFLDFESAEAGSGG